MSMIIVVPCYNEAGRFDPEAFRRFADDHPQVDFLLVDDGSTDGTPAILDRLAALRPGRIEVLRLPRNQAKAEAVRQGFLRAFERSPRYVGFWDADLATPLRLIPSFATVLDERPEIAVVIGSRVKLLGREIHRNAWRHYLGRVFSTAVSLALGVPVYDTQCGAKLFRLTDATRALFARPFRSRWIFDVEILARLIRAARTDGATPLEDCVYELPLIEWRDVPGSKIRFHHFPRAFADLLLIYRAELRPRLPAAPTHPPTPSETPTQTTPRP